jgi:hypothetical protein
MLALTLDAKKMFLEALLAGVEIEQIRIEFGYLLDLVNMKYISFYRWVSKNNIIM